MLTSATADVSVSGSCGISGARITLWKASSIIRETTADTSGNFTFNGISPAAYALTAYKGGYFPGTMQIKATDKKLDGIEIKLSPIPEISLSNLSMCISGTAEVDHDGDGTLEAVIPGDLITARDGDICGQSVVEQSGEYGAMTIYGDDPATVSIDEGYLAGEKLNLFINGAHAAASLSFTNHATQTLSLSARGTARRISLKSGWNLVSLGLIPDSDSIETIFSGIDNMRYILGFFRNPPDKGSEGFRTYLNLPEVKSFSTLTALDPDHGYWVYMTGDDTLEVSGNRMPGNHSISLGQGWNLAGYWLESSHILPTAQNQLNTSIASIFGDTAISGEVEYIMGFYRFPPDAGMEGFRTFMNNSALNFSTLRELTPNMGYWIYLKNEGLLQYVPAIASLNPPHWISASDASFTDRVRVTWGTVVDAACYQVFRADSITGAYSAVSSQIAETAYEDSGVSAGVLYYYKVMSVNNTGEASQLSACDSGYSALSGDNNTPFITSVEVLGDSGEITFFYTLFDPDNDTCSVQVFYSLDDGYSYTRSANISGTLTGITPGIGAVTWSSRSDITGNHTRVRIKIVPDDGLKVGLAGESGMFKVKNGDLASLALQPSVILLDKGYKYDLSYIRVLAEYTVGSSTEVNSEIWSLTSGGGTIEGKLYSVPLDTGSVILTASYTEGTVTRTAELLVTVKDLHNTGECITVSLTGEVSMEFVRIPSGSLTMGSPENEPLRDTDEVQHTVSITKDFYLGKYEVTQAQWQAVTGSNPSHFSGNPNYPVEQVSWADCQDFIKLLNDKGKATFRLPYEAEWEYACRAGTVTPYYWGDYIDGNHMWYFGMSSGHTHDVGQKLPNPWGLYDMSGNVWEWCNDWYGDYTASPAVDPAGSESGPAHVLRGGSWLSFSQYCRSASRVYFNPDYHMTMHLGLRLVAEADSIVTMNSLKLDPAVINLDAGQAFDLSLIRTFAAYSDGSSAEVYGEIWSLSSGGGTIQNNVYTASTDAGIVVLNARYTEGGVTETAELRITVWAIPVTGECITLPLTGEVTMDFVWIPAGSFTMGSPPDEPDREPDEGPQHTVNITKGFYLGKYEVAQYQWRAVTGSNPSNAQGADYPDSDFYPLEGITWDDCQSFAAALNGRGTGTFRLPTEAEWEYACRAGTTTTYYWGSTIEDAYFWYQGNSGGTFHEVGMKLPNAWGLYDMIGGIDELCQDWYNQDYYCISPADDPPGAAPDFYHALRGGSFCTPVNYCRSAKRFYDDIIDWYWYNGLRLAVNREARWKQVTPEIRTVSSISLCPGVITLNSGDSYDLGKITVTAHYLNTAQSTATGEVWSKSSGCGTIEHNVYTAPADTGSVVLTASYTEGGSTVSTDLRITVRNIPSTGETMSVNLTGVLSMDFVWVPAGSFVMGSPDTELGRHSDEGPRHTVNISKGFWLGKYEVTQDQWQEVVPMDNPSHCQGAGYPNSGVRPVEVVSFSFCQYFIEMLNRRGIGTFRLPTEAEWEYACRAGTQTAYYWGDTADVNCMWYEANSGGESHAVGLLQPNAWGLHDMPGNVWEWCSDLYGPYSDEEEDDPAGPSSGSEYVYRGSGYDSYSTYSRSATRGHSPDQGAGFYNGVRLVVGP
ncbi:MAG: SUMF1/EgtB/PvdO family nonheme iron enzyme [Candidatus Wallbacteria bacterium]|nr:SUMF1/EgtB/PvdO family nonheme iron enzyme [Candidatus Wallbacteria bacterium]